MTTRGIRRWLVIGLSAFAAAVALTGCAGTPTQSPHGGHPSVAAQPVSTLRVGLTEWAIEKSAGMLEPGPVTLLVTNAGETQHNLYVTDGRRLWHTRNLEPGQRARLRIQAARGAHLKLWCDIPGHAAQGMRTTIAVAHRAVTPRPAGAPATGTGSG